MSKLRKKISFETTFGVYVVDEVIGEGGAGLVYGGVGPDESPIALKVLAEERATADKRRRFKKRALLPGTQRASQHRYRHRSRCGARWRKRGTVLRHAQVSV